MRFKVYPEVFEKIPDVFFGAVIAYNVDNTIVNNEIAELLAEEVGKLREKLGGTEVKENENIVPYREAFVKLGINPNKFMSSIEAMTKRIAKGSDLPSISPIVDLGNAISLRNIVPLGAHDIDALEEEIAVRFSVPGDIFIPLGCEDKEEVEEGELIYSDIKNVRTRRWIWRQSEKGKITEKSRNIFFPIDGFSAHNKESVIKAADELAFLLQKYFNCETREYFIDRNLNEIEF